jgi:hypothetical protein
VDFRWCPFVVVWCPVLMVRAGVSVGGVGIVGEAGDGGNDRDGSLGKVADD